jgi:hypothetical protein
MKTVFKFLAFLALAIGAFAQQGQMASSFTASSAAPHFTLNRATTAQESSIFFKTAGATTGGWRIYGSGITNQVLNIYSYQAGATVGAWDSTGLSVTGAISSTAGASISMSGGNSLQIQGTDGVIYRSGGSGTNPGFHRFRYFDTDVGVFSSIGLAVTGLLSNAYSGAGSGALIRNTSDTSGSTFLSFNKANNTIIGSVTRVTTTDAVTYNTTSDGRLKENIRDFTGDDSGPIIDELRPRWFDWKNSTDDDGKDAIGFVAQELACVPVLVKIGAVSPGDDDPEVITKQWQRSDSALIPILVAEIQALRARVAALEALNNPTP